ncbi:NAD(P)-dependent oxidoreductase [Nostoc sp. PCC 7107]|uniref:NAD-dependent epimerase/dehydratase family protein n=1 Tax=Nostoc sp. PCC 7107 TaxID=317936 RepID=UPI00029ECF98|nr:NAD(P)-dependent oxidoreductase [Nostoc sp. PCC 7107]AFY41480.1 NAD-dependent epimerase/dehydratase [Nostoc sp. PCC 7107]
MKILIVGYKGFIGKYLFNHLKLLGADVYGISSSEKNGIDGETGILSEQFTISPGTDAVIYLAQSPYYRQIPEKATHLLNVNVISAVKMVEIARKAKVPRFIYTSTGNVYTPSFQPLIETSSLNINNWYSLSKIHAEEALALFRNDMDITITRLFGVYGPGQTDKLIPRLINTILQGNKIFLERNQNDINDLDGLKLSMIYIYDLVEILTELLRKSFNHYLLNISSQEVLTLREIANKIAIFSQKQVNIELADKIRYFDLIADTTLLNQALSPIFTPFNIGIEKTIMQSLHPTNHCER